MVGMLRAVGTVGTVGMVGMVRPAVVVAAGAAGTGTGTGTAGPKELALGSIEPRTRPPVMQVEVPVERAAELPSAAPEDQASGAAIVLLRVAPPPPHRPFTRSSSA